MGIARSISSLAPGHHKVLNNLTKSPADKRDFRALELDNALRVLLIHDKETDMSASALSVAVGSMSDPVEFPGLAHFLEHMVFLGTEKYPDESGFDIFLNENGGFSNAYTNLDSTVYFFEVSPEMLGMALDRFAQFFISPIFNESATEREVNAVNSENEKNIPNDTKRIFRVDQATSHPGHPYSKFTTGNVESLWIKPLKESLDVRKNLIEFYQKFYSSNLMVLVVIGREKLDELQVIVESLFSTVVNKKNKKQIWPISTFIYLKEHLQLRIDIFPIQDLRTLTLTFPVPDTSAFYGCMPIIYIAYLIAHEGAGGLLSLLKRKNWANDIISGTTTAARGFNFFVIQFGIESWENIDTIIEHTFQYLKILRDYGPQKWIWKEIKTIREIQFRFQDKPIPGRYVIALADKLHNYPLKDILTVGHILTDYNPTFLRKMLNLLLPSNCRVTTVSKENESTANLTEPWYGVKYSVQKINSNVLKNWTNCEKHNEFKFPEKNEFIPSAFDMKAREDTGIFPKILINNQMSRAWFLQDNEFLLPKARVHLEIYNPLPLLNELHCALNNILTRVIEDTLTEIVYSARIAGIFQSVSSTSYGVEICVRGYDHKLKLLLYKVLDTFINFSVDSKRFMILKEVYYRQLKNWEDSEPRVHALWYVSHILAEKDWTRQAILETLEGITVERLQIYVKDFISQLRLQWLFCGNFTSSEARVIVNEVEQMFLQNGTKPLVLPQEMRLRSIQLAPGSDQIYERNHLSHSSSCIAVVFQGGIKNTRDNMIIELLGLITEQPCYQQLRTHEQLGYVVYTGVRKLFGVLGLVILVQSNFHPNYLESRIDNFLQILKERICGMSGDEFFMFRKALVIRKSEKIKSLTARTAFVWNEIHIEEYNFDRKNKELKELESISHHEVYKYFEDLIGPPLKEKGRLGVHIISQTKDGTGHKSDCFGPHPIDLSMRTINPIPNLIEWKCLQNLYSRPPKHVLVIPSKLE